MIDPRLQAALDDTAAPAVDVEDRAVHGPLAEPCPDPSADEEADEAAARRNKLIDLVAAHNPEMAPLAEAAKSEIRLGSDGTLIVSPALRAAMRALVPGRDTAPTDGMHRRIGDWLTADNTVLTPVTETSPYFTVSHWHWLAATGKVRRIPAELGPTFPHLLTSEAQITHDLTAWSALDPQGRITSEAETMFGAVTGHASLTVYGTVLLYGQRRAASQLPSELKGFGLEAAVRDVPRVTFIIGITTREVVTALVNNISVVFTRRLRRNDEAADAAAAILELLNPDGHWNPYPLPRPVVLPGTVIDDLAANSDTATLFDAEPDADVDADAASANAAARERARAAATKVLRAAKIPSAAQSAIAQIAAATTHALAQITVSTSNVDVPRGDPGALALAFLRDRGVVASYPSGSGKFRRITYTSGDTTGITSGINALIGAYNRG